MSDPKGTETRWIAPLTPEERRFLRANEEINAGRQAAINARRTRMASSSAAMGGEFHMSSSAMNDAYAKLHAQYQDVVRMRRELEHSAGQFSEHRLGGQIQGVVAAGEAARNAVRRRLMTELIDVEKELVTVLNGMYGSYHGSAATDADRAAAIRAAGGHGGGAGLGRAAADGAGLR